MPLLRDYSIRTVTDKGSRRTSTAPAATRATPVVELPTKQGKVRKTSAQLQRFLEEDGPDHRSLAVAGSEAHHEAAKEERRKAIEQTVTREY
jgi:hypothetical protein